MNSIVIQIKLSTYKDVKEFIDITNSFPMTVDIELFHNRYRVDGRSIMGVYSLNLTEPIGAEIISDYELPQKYAEQLSKWIINEVKYENN